jgi:tetratricopeptide (TPR) repeat protein
MRKTPLSTSYVARRALLFFDFMTTKLFPHPGLAVFIASVFFFAPIAQAEESDKAADTNTQDVVRAYLQLQEQLHATQLAIERTRLENEAAALRNAENTSNRLHAIEQSLAAERTREMQAVHQTNRLLLVVLALFAGLGFLPMLLTTFFHWRSMNRLSEISTGLALGSAGAVPLLGPGMGRSEVATSDPQSSRLLGIIDRLEKRILQLEQPMRTPLPQGGHDSNGDSLPGAEGAFGASPSTNDELPADKTARITLLLGKGQSLLNLDQPDDALNCFDEVLDLDKNNTEALVKKGVALERLRKINEALECYDRAIAADSSMTIAYLYKGGLYNRMERFNEALECYEQALRTQEKREG